MNAAEGWTWTMWPWSNLDGVKSRLGSWTLCVLVDVPDHRLSSHQGNVQLNLILVLFLGLDQCLGDFWA